MPPKTFQTLASTGPAQTWPDEIAQTVKRISVGWRRGDMGRLSLWTAIFLARHACASGSSRTLEDVGQQFGLTRERVRQICAHITRSIMSVRPPMPITANIIDRLRQLAPVGEVEANAQLIDLLGAGTGAVAVLAFAQDVAPSPLPIKVAESRMRMQGQPVGIRMLVSCDEPAWAEEAIKIARDDIASMGCTNVLRVAGQLALGHGHAVRREALSAALALTPGFRWIEPEGGWFTVGDGGSSSNAAGRVRKLLTVALEPVSVDEIAEALITDDLWLSRERDRAAGLPPLHVLREMMSGWEWLRCFQHNRFSLSDAATAEGRRVLSESEEMTVAVIAENDGVACRHQILGRLFDGLGVTPVGVNAMLGSSPILRKIEHGLYTLRGRRVGNHALSQARSRLTLASAPDRLEALDAPWPNAQDFALRITKASLRHEQYGIPVRLRDSMPPGDVAVVLPDGRKEVAKMAASGALRHINRLFVDLQPGDVIGCRWQADALHCTPAERAPALGLASR